MRRRWTSLNVLTVFSQQTPGYRTDYGFGKHSLPVAAEPFGDPPMVTSNAGQDQIYDGRRSLMTVTRDSSNIWTDHRAVAQSPYSGSSSGIGAYSPPHEFELGNIEDSVACPYGCGTILTGVHAFGNLTRHLKTKGCAASGRVKVDYGCQVHGCGRKYSRSDGCE